MKRSQYFLLSVLALVVMLASCSNPTTPPPTQTPLPTNTFVPTATPVPPTPTQTPQTEFLINASEFPSCFDQESGAEWKAFGNGLGKNGKIHMMILQPPYGFFDPCDDQVFSNFTFEADATLVDPGGSTSKTYYGLVFRQNLDTNQDYMFFVGDGHASLNVDYGPPSADSTKSLLNWLEVPELNKVGEANHLKVVAVGGTIKAFVNDTLVGEVQDATVASGTVAFFLQTGDSKEQQVVFEHAKVTKIP